ncbi:hypothetical protein A2U01_0089129 [Trifolium medium]|uniref:Uncharacterized protein n=1 Tax=Trifolium medium TaxID=97028 RepID=A0A392U5R3_9FABA|nr:hypothetical protein [Trifolium medium]
MIGGDVLKMMWRRVVLNGFNSVEDWPGRHVARSCLPKRACVIHAQTGGVRF